MLGKLDQPQADGNVKHPNVEQYRKNKDQILQNLGVRSIGGTVATRYLVTLVWLHHKFYKINNGVEQCRVVDWSIKTFFFKLKKKGKNIQ